MSIERNGTTDYMSATVAYNGVIFVSGQVANDLSASLEEQTVQVLNNLKAKLEQAGTSIDKLLQTTVYMSDIRGFDTMNAAWKDWFDGINMPTRATVETRLADPGMQIEIVGIAAT